MKHLFVPYELALLAKEKGFNEPCFMSYEGSNNLCERTVLSRNDYYESDDEKYYCSAPIYQQLINWLYKDSGIWIIISDYNHVDTPKTGFRFSISIWGFTEIGMSKNGDFKTHQEALTKAIEESFKLI